MFGLGLGELLVILVVVLILFGSTKLPQLGQGLGEGIKSFRKAFRDVGGGEKKDDGPGPPPAK
jgi:sec-independent protein translocase protein TatA